MATPRTTIDPLPAPAKLRTSDVRMFIAIPALVVLLAIGMGVANYWVYLDLADYVERNAPNLDTTLFQRRVLSILLVFSFLAAVSGGVLVWTVLRPLRALTEAVAGFASGRLRAPVDIPSGMFEVDQLGKTFNSMVGFINTIIEEREGILSEWAQGGSMIVDERRRITSVNDEGLRILGAQAASLAGLDIDEIRRDQPDLAPRLMEYAAQCVASPAARINREIEATRPGEAALNVSCNPLLDYGHGPTAFLIHFHDARLVRSLNRLFSRTDHLAALGTFTVGLSHELRNPLATLKGNAQLLGSQVGRDSKYVPYIERMVREIDRLDRLVRELYDFSRIPVEQSESFDLNILVRQAYEEARQAIDPEIVETRPMEYSLDPALPAAFGQTERIHRAIANVVTNAYEHMQPGGLLTLRTHTSNSPFPGAILLDIRNSGSTIPPENRERIFEPFFSTRSGGTGLGLAIAYQIVAQNRGTLTVECGENDVCFRFALRPALPVSPEQKDPLS